MFSSSSVGGTCPTSKPHDIHSRHLPFLLPSPVLQPSHSNHIDQTQSILNKKSPFIESEVLLFIYNKRSYPQKNPAPKTFQNKKRLQTMPGGYRREINATDSRFSSGYRIFGSKPCSFLPSSITSLYNTVVPYLHHTSNQGRSDCNSREDGNHVATCVSTGVAETAGGLFGGRDGGGGCVACGRGFDLLGCEGDERSRRRVGLRGCGVL
jgi:hypothetical protein